MIKIGHGSYRDSISLMSSLSGPNSSGSYSRPTFTLQYYASCQLLCSHPHPPAALIIFMCYLFSGVKADMYIIAQLGHGGHGIRGHS